MSVDELRRRMAMGWFPPRGSVVIARVRGSMHEARCQVCADALRSTIAGCQVWRRTHLCRAGTVGAWPHCPTCAATWRGCKQVMLPGGPRVVDDRYMLARCSIPTPAGGTALVRWHPDRLALYRMHTGGQGEVLQPSARPRGQR